MSETFKKSQMCEFFLCFFRVLDGRVSQVLPWICQWIDYIVERLHGHNSNISDSRRLRLYLSHCKCFETSPGIEFYLRCSLYLLVIALSNEKIPLHLCHFKRSRLTNSLNLFIWVARSLDSVTKTICIVSIQFRNLNSKLYCPDFSVLVLN